jgi:hypothetical protein
VLSPRIPTWPTNSVTLDSRNSKPRPAHSHISESIARVADGSPAILAKLLCYRPTFFRPRLRSNPRSPHAAESGGQVSAGRPDLRAHRRPRSRRGTTAPGWLGRVERERKKKIRFPSLAGIPAPCSARYRVSAPFVLRGYGSKGVIPVPSTGEPSTTSVTLMLRHAIYCIASIASAWLRAAD